MAEKMSENRNIDLFSENPMPDLEFTKNNFDFQKMQSKNKKYQN